MAPQKKKEAKYEKLLRKIYYTPKEAASFGGIQRLKETSHTKGKQGSHVALCRAEIAYLVSYEIMMSFKETFQKFH